jgi:hypothetical protein
MKFRRAGILIVLLLTAIFAVEFGTAVTWNAARADSATVQEGLPGEPVPQGLLLESLPDYVRQSSPRLVTHPDGDQEIVFDRELARACKYDLPFCEPRDPSAPRRDPTQVDLDRLTREGASCRAMADRIMLGPPSGPGPAGP